MIKWHPDDMLLDSKSGADDATFFGIDWGRKDWTLAVCPECQQPHRWKARKPKCCRRCGIKFLYTASSFVPPTNRGGGK
jgi:hypothetical protein